MLQCGIIGNLMPREKRELWNRGNSCVPHEIVQCKERENNCNMDYSNLIKTIQGQSLEFQIFDI